MYIKIMIRIILSTVVDLMILSLARFNGLHCSRVCMFLFFFVFDSDIFKRMK